MCVVTQPESQVVAVQTDQTVELAALLRRRIRALLRQMLDPLVQILEGVAQSRIRLTQDLNQAMLKGLDLIMRLQQLE